MGVFSETFLRGKQIFHLIMFSILSMSITLFPVLWLIVEWKFCLRITIFLPTSGPLLELKYLHWFSLCLSRPLILKFNIASDVTYIAHKISLFQQLIPLIVAAGLWKQRTLKQGVHLIKCVWKRTLFDKGILRLRHYFRHHHQRIISPKGVCFLMFGMQWLLRYQRLADITTFNPSL